MKHIGTILTCIFSCAVAGVSAQVTERIMTLDELYALADTQSTTIKIFETALVGAEQDISVARKATLPTIQF